MEPSVGIGSPPKRPASQPPSPGKCGKEAFAAVYNATAPSKDEVRAALRDLNACKSAGMISQAEYDETQAALVARL